MNFVKIDLEGFIEVMSLVFLFRSLRKEMICLINIVGCDGSGICILSFFREVDMG